jgi:hypothetical protein
MINLFRWWQSCGDRRRDFRQEIRRPGIVDLGNGTGQRGCMIGDISAGGAKLMISPFTDLPEQFILLVPHQCRIVRRSDGYLGVRFVD